MGKRTTAKPERALGPMGRALAARLSAEYDIPMPAAASCLQTVCVSARTWKPTRCDWRARKA